MRAMMVGLSVMVWLAACGVGQGGDTEAVASDDVATKEDELVFRRTPTELDTLTPPYLSQRLRSAYMIAIPDPRDRDDFVAWVYDVRTRRNVLFVHGNTARQWNSFNHQVADELEAIADAVAHGQTDFSFNWCIAGQVKGPGPGTPG